MSDSPVDLQGPSTIHRLHVGSHFPLSYALLCLNPCHMHPLPYSPSLSFSFPSIPFLSSTLPYVSPSLSFLLSYTDPRPSHTPICIHLHSPLFTGGGGSKAWFSWGRHKWMTPRQAGTAFRYFIFSRSVPVLHNLRLYHCPPLDYPFSSNSQSPCHFLIHPTHIQSIST